MVKNKKPLNILFRTTTVDLLSKWYAIDNPNKERSFSEWIDEQLLFRLQEREVIE